MVSIVQAVGLTKQVLSGDQPLIILHDVTFSVEAAKAWQLLGHRARANLHFSAYWPDWTCQAAAACA